MVDFKNEADIKRILLKTSFSKWLLLLCQIIKTVSKENIANQYLVVIHCFDDILFIRMCNIQVSFKKFSFIVIQETLN